jgi:cell division protein FtsA
MTMGVQMRKRELAQRGLIAARRGRQRRCFIARTGAPEPQVTGIGHQVAHGVRGGTIVDMEAAERAILSTVHAAEQMAGETIREVIVNVSGGRPHSQTIGVRWRSPEVSEATCAGADFSTVYQSPQDRRPIHSIPVSYSIDGSRGIRDPRGMFGDKLGVDMHLVTAAAGPLRNLQTCVQRCHLDIQALVVSPYAAGLATLVEDEMELGVTVIDMGGGATTIAVFFDGNAVFTDAIPIGGGHVTNDIARGLSTPLVHAERMKTLYGNCIPSPADERDMITVPQVGEEDPAKSTTIPRSILVGIVQPRMEETFELVAPISAGGFNKIAGAASSDRRRQQLSASMAGGTGPRQAGPHGSSDPRRRLAEATGGRLRHRGGPSGYALAADVETLRPGRLISTGESNGVFGRLGHWFRENF